MSNYYQARYDNEFAEKAREFMKELKINILWEARENPGNTGKNVHYHAILTSDLKLSSIRKYRTNTKIIEGGQGALSFGDIENVDNFLNYIHKGEFVEETGNGKFKKYISHTKSHPFITKVPGTEPTVEKHWNIYLHEHQQYSDKYYHDRFWNFMQENKRVVKIEKDKDGVHTVHKKDKTGNNEFIEFMIKSTCYKTVDGNIILNENIKMSDIVEKVVDYYRLENKDFSDIVLQNKMNLYYAT
ncbi:hypothetical protein EON73_04435, partial [bacterium]